MTGRSSVCKSLLQQYPKVFRDLDLLRKLSPINEKPKVVVVSSGSGPLPLLVVVVIIEEEKEERNRRSDSSSSLLFDRSELLFIPDWPRSPWLSLGLLQQLHVFKGQLPFLPTTA